jgi:hypothetical protein
MVDTESTPGPGPDDDTQAKPTKHHPALATAGLVGACALVFGATAAFAATPDSTKPIGRSAQQISHNGATHHVPPGPGTHSGGQAAGSPSGQGSHGEQTVKSSAGQWLDEAWQTGKVGSISGDQVAVTDDSGTTWQWTVDPTAKVRTQDETDDLSSINVGDTVSLAGTHSGSAYTATVVIDPGNAHSLELGSQTN